jgi:hypothetical protein
LSCNLNPANSNKVEFYSPADAALIPGKRVIPDMATFLPLSFTRMETLVCPNVLSFQVQIMPLNSNSFDDVPAPGAPLLYDTTKFNTPAAGYPQVGLKAIQVTLRVWDQTTQQTRQITVVQDL